MFSARRVPHTVIGVSPHLTATHKTHNRGGGTSGLSWDKLAVVGGQPRAVKGEGGRRRSNALRRKQDLDMRPDSSTRAGALSSQHNTRLCSRSDYL